MAEGSFILLCKVWVSLLFTFFFSSTKQYVDNLKQKEIEEKEARLAKLRPAIRNMLRGNPNVFHYTTFATADRLFAQHPIWQQAKIESERKLVFEEYVTELKQREVVSIFPPTSQGQVLTASSR